MKFIAHRGLINGPNTCLENTPEQIYFALSQGYNCEIDVWFIDGHWWLGHDKPQYSIELDFLNDNRFWIHCKNHLALNQLHAAGNHNYFWHQNDDIVLTSKNFFWTYPGKPLFSNSICVMPEWVMPMEEIKTLNCYGVCSDYILDIQKGISNEV